MRLFSRRLLALGFGLGLAGVAPAAESFDGVVQQLAHPKYAEREKAAKQLVEIGEPALPSLRAVLSSTDQEGRQRAEQLIAKIESAARSKKLLAAPKLRIKIDDKPLDKAVAEVAKLAKLPLTLNVAGPALNKKITVDTGELPYWEALEAFFKAAGLGEEAGPPPGPPAAPQPDIAIQKQIIINGPPGMAYDSQPAAVPRNIRLAVSSKPMPSVTGNGIRVKASSQPLLPGKDNVSNDVRLSLQVDPHPGLTLNEITGIDIRKATAADGRALEITRTTRAPLPGSQEEMLLMGGQGGGQLQAIQFDGLDMPRQNMLPSLIPVTLKTGGEKVKELQELSGVLTARLIAPKDTLFTLDRVKEASGRQVMAADGLRITVHGATTRLTRTAVVRLTMELDATAQNFLHFQVPFKGRGAFLAVMTDDNYGRSQGQAPDFYLLLPSGEMSKALSVAATAIDSTETGTRYDLEVLFDKPEKWDGVGFTAKGRRVVTVDMPFTLTNVPVP